MCPYKRVFLVLCVALPCFVSAAETRKIKAYELTYEEQEAGTDRYLTKMVVTDTHLRIDTVDDSSGYIVYDSKNEAIYSVSNMDKTVLVVKKYNYSKPDLALIARETYSEMPDVPEIAGHNVIDYSLVDKKNDSNICANIQIASGLLPAVAKTLQSYWIVVSGQQVKNLDKTPDEFRTPCYLADQIYNTGSYYSKGLPIQEWHSNGKQKLLKDFKKIEVKADIFDVPETYHQYSIE